MTNQPKSLKLSVTGNLPYGYEWGEQTDDKYRPITKGGEVVTHYGGTMFICCTAPQNDYEIAHQIAKAEREANRVRQ